MIERGLLVKSRPVGASGWRRPGMQVSNPTNTLKHHMHPTHLNSKARNVNKITGYGYCRLSK